jgi:hypothetical protein
VHERRVTFVAGEYWLIEDRLRGRRPHRYDLRFHLAPDAWGATVVEGCAVRAPGLGLFFNAPAAPRLERGWVSERYGEKRPAPVVSVAVEGVREADFVTLVVPMRS